MRIGFNQPDEILQFSSSCFLILGCEGCTGTWMISSGFLCGWLDCCRVGEGKKEGQQGEQLGSLICSRLWLAPQAFSLVFLWLQHHSCCQTGAGVRFMAVYEKAFLLGIFLRPLTVHCHMGSPNLGTRSDTHPITIAMFCWLESGHRS